MGEGEVLTAEHAWAQWEPMVNAAARMLHNRDEAAECATQAIVQILERKPSDVLNPEAFMVTIAKRRAVDCIRVRGRARRAAMRLSFQEVAADIAEAICDQHEASWVDAYARKHLERPVYRLLQHVGDGLTVADAAAAEGMTVKAAESHLVRARRMVRGAALRALSVFAGLLALIRRAVTTPCTVTAALAAITILSFPPPSSQTFPLSTPEVDSSSSAPASAQPQRNEGRSSMIQLLSAVGHSAGTTARLTRPSGGSVPSPALATPAVRVGTYRGNDGYQPAGPVDRIKHCLDTVTIFGPTIGCR